MRLHTERATRCIREYYGSRNVYSVYRLNHKNYMVYFKDETKKILPRDEVVKIVNKIESM